MKLTSLFRIASSSSVTAERSTSKERRSRKFSLGVLLGLLIVFLAPVHSLLAQEKAEKKGGRERQSKIATAKEDNSPVERDKRKIFGPGREDSEQVRKREEWFYRQRSLPSGHIPAGARFRAFQHMQNRLVAEGRLIRRPDGAFAAAAGASSVSAGAWNSIGPTPTTQGFFSPVSGRVTTIAVDPNDHSGDTVLIGGAQGGIWRTVDGGANWTAVGDSNPSLAMGSIAFAKSSPAIVYAGTGEQASIGFDVYYGAGVLKSTDGGLTWNPTCTTPSDTCPFIGPFLSGTAFGFFNFGGARISYVDVNPANPNLVLAGVQKFTGGPTAGVYCSDDGGATWANILSGQMSTFVGFASATTAYVALGRPFGTSSSGAKPNGIYKSTNADGGSTKKCSAITFAAQTAATLPTQSSIGRIDMGIAAADTTGNTVYASISNAADASSTNLGVWKTTNGGTNWTKTAAPDVCRQQCWYDNVVKADPNNSNIVFLGGGAAQIGGSFSWVVRTTNGGTTFSPAVPTAQGSGTPHVDNHAMAFFRATSGPNTGSVILYLGNDGGMWRTTNAEATTVTWTNLNTNLTLSQFYPSLSIHPSNPAISFAGTQDNGSQNYAGGTSWIDNNTCGDGGQTALDPNVPSSVYVTCQVIDINFSAQGGAQGSFTPIDNGINPNDVVNFIPPITIDPTTSRLYFGTDHVYQSVDNGSNWVAISGALPTFGSNLTALAVAPGNPSVVYAGGDDGILFVATDVTPGGATFNNVAGQAQLPPSREVMAIAIDPTNSNTVYAAFSGFAFGGVAGDPKGHIMKSVNGGAAWSEVSCHVADCATPAGTDLPNIPVNDLVIDPDSSSVLRTLFAATDLGVYASNDDGATWSVLGTGLPNVAVLSLRLHEPTRTLRAATHGRGIWDVTLANFTFSGTHISTLSPVSVQAPAASALTLTITGSGLLPGPVVKWNGSTTGVTTIPGTATQLTATIVTSLLAGAGTPKVTVTVGASTSNALTFTVLGGAPTLASVSPTSTPVQTPTPSTNVDITLTGTNFIAGSKAQFNGSSAGITVSAPTGACPLPTCLTATLPASLLGPFGSTNDITVLNPPPGGGVSAAKTFVVQAPRPPNDDFVNAINITTNSFADTKDSSGAMTETTDPTPACSQSPFIPFTTGRDNTIWYKFTPPTGGTANLDTQLSSYDTVLSVWTGSAGSLAAVPGGCNDDIVPGVVIVSQISALPLTSGTTYFIIVSSFGAADPNPVAFGGKSVLNFNFTPTPDFTITTGGTTTQTVNAGQTATFTNVVSITAQNGFAAAVNLTCSLTAARTTCVVNPASLTPTPGGVSASVTVTTTARSLAPPTGITRRFGPNWKTLPVAFLAALALFLMAMRVKSRRLRLVASSPLAAIILLLVFQAVGCSGSNGPPPVTGTPAGTYPVTVTGRSGALTHTSTVTLKVN